MVNTNFAVKNDIFIRFWHYKTAVHRSNQPSVLLFKGHTFFSKIYKNNKYLITNHNHRKKIWKIIVSSHVRALVRATSNKELTRPKGRWSNPASPHTWLFLLWISIHFVGHECVTMHLLDLLLWSFKFKPETNLAIISMDAFRFHKSK